jgi:hypothetical protein
MRKLALALLVTLLVVASRSKPAAAHCGQDCPLWLDAMALSLAAGIVGGYAYGTGYMVYRDATGEEQTLSYGGTELAINAALGSLFVGGTVAEVKDGNYGQAAVTGAFALTHAALATHGAYRVYELRGEIRPDPKTVAAFVGLGYASNALYWALQAPGPHGRGWGVAEAAVNAPMAAGLAYLAVDRANDGHDRQAVLFGGMAAVSGALALHGAWYAIAPTRKPLPDLDLGLDLGIGADIAPTAVTDGKEVAPGLGASGTW